MRALYEKKCSLFFNATAGVTRYSSIGTQCGSKCLLDGRAGYFDFASNSYGIVVRVVSTRVMARIWLEISDKTVQSQINLTHLDFCKQLPF